MFARAVDHGRGRSRSIDPEAGIARSFVVKTVSADGRFPEYAFESQRPVSGVQRVRAACSRSRIQAYWRLPAAMMSSKVAKASRAFAQSSAVAVIVIACSARM
jgi:hypothetical protein